MSNHVITLVGRAGCHLCDDARDVVLGVLARGYDAYVDLVELNIDDDRALHDEYWEQIPVLLIDGKVHNFWRIDPVRLSKALAELGHDPV